MSGWRELESELRDPSVDRATLCRRVLAEITYPEYAANWETAVADRKLPAGLRLALAALDPARDHAGAGVLRRL